MRGLFLISAGPAHPYRCLYICGIPGNQTRLSQHALACILHIHRNPLLLQDILDDLSVNTWRRPNQTYADGMWPIAFTLPPTYTTNNSDGRWTGDDQSTGERRGICKIQSGHGGGRGGELDPGNTKANVTQDAGRRTGDGEGDDGAEENKEFVDTRPRRNQLESVEAPQEYGAG